MTGPASTEPSFDELLAALRRSHDRLAAALSPLSDEQVSGRSYDTEWTIAQVASHLGSGAEIFGMFIEAGLKQQPVPGASEFGPVWAAWDEKAPPQQARDALLTDSEFLAQLAGLTPDDQAGWRLDMFGEVRTLPNLLRMRLAEHAVHTWDIAVMHHPAETVADDAVELVVDNVPGLADRAGKGAAQPVTVLVTTSDPDRRYLLELTTDKARLTEASGDAKAAATLELPAEAFVRLAYGRLDPDHTPGSVRAEGVELGTLRKAFPGF
jgi:uncharacterized protein (TIGR03083 family)